MDTSAGNLGPFCYPSGLTPQPRAIFASKLRPLEIPPEQALFSMGLTLPPPPIFAVGTGQRETLVRKPGILATWLARYVRALCKTAR